MELARVVTGEDQRTTIMIRNIPNKYTQQMLLESIDQCMEQRYDFFYLPIDFKNKCNMGYAFINFVHAVFIPEFYHQFNGKKWACFNSEKICKISYGRIQGKQALENNFATMQQVCLDKATKVRPLVLNPPMPSKNEIEKYQRKLLSHDYIRSIKNAKVQALIASELSADNESYEESKRIVVSQDLEDSAHNSYEESPQMKYRQRRQVGLDSAQRSKVSNLDLKNYKPLQKKLFVAKT